MKLPKIEARERRYLTAEQVNALAGAISDPYQTLVYVLAYGGIRWGEAVALRRGRCKLNRLEVVESLSEAGGALQFGHTKTYQRREVILPGFLSMMLAGHLAHHVDDHPDALVFTSPNNTHLRHANFRKRVWLPAIENVGLDGLTIHELRHTCAALLISEGWSPKAIQTQLGHSSIRVTFDVYGHLFESDREELAGRLDRLYERSRGSNVDKTWTGGASKIAGIPVSGYEAPAR